MSPAPWWGASKPGKKIGGVARYFDDRYFAFVSCVLGYAAKYRSLG